MFRVEQTKRRTACLVLVGFAATLGMSGVAFAQSRGFLYASVIGADGTPVVDLSADDFSLSLDGTPLTVVSAKVQSDPMKVALMVDNGNAMSEANGDTSLRAGLASFVDTLDPVHEIGVFTLAGNVQRRVDFTSDRDDLRKGTGEIFAEGGGPKMMDGLFETWDRRFDDDDAWPVFVVLVTDANESSGYIGDNKYNDFIDDLRAREATVHVLVVAVRGADGQNAAQTQYGLNLTGNTGGVFESIATVTGITDQLTAFANRLNVNFELVSTRYRVVYERPDDVGGGGGISVSVSRPSVNLHLFADRRPPQ